MGARRWILRLSVLGAVLAVGRLPVAPACADGGWWSDLDKGQGVRLTDVLEAPDRHRGRSLTFTCVFHQQEREFNPLRTRFNAERYDNISVWPDGAVLWKQEDYARDFPFLYVARNNPQRDALLRLEGFTRIELTARIEAVVDGNPFLEVVSARVTGHRLGREVMTYMLRGEVHGRTAGAESQTLAAENFEAALRVAPDLAPIYATLVRQRLAEALRNLGRDDEAARVLAGGTSTTAPLDLGTEPATFPAVNRDSLPGEEVIGPPTTPTLPPPADLPPPRRSAPPPPAPPSESPVEPAPQFVPGERIEPSLPGVPVGEEPLPARARMPLPPPPLPQPSSRATLPGTAPQGVAPPVGAPKVIDPPLPPTPPGGAPPPRRPRLAGVK